MKSVRRRVCSVFLAFAFGLASIQAVAEPANGWWWNPNESGRGFFVEQTEGVFYVGGYFYDGDGRATWATASGQVSDPYRLEGRLQSYAGGQALFGEYRPPGSMTDIGPISIRFADDSHATITWPGGTVAVERHVYGEEEDPELFYTAEVPFRPQIGWWWSPQESGRGFSIEVQGTTLFVAAFMYDDAGQPVWYIASGPMTTPRSFRGDLLQFSGGQTMAGPYRPPGPPRRIGSLTIEFAAVDQAAITVSDDMSVRTAAFAPLQSRGLPSQRPMFPRYIWSRDDQWPKYEGELKVYYKVVTEAGTTGTFTKQEAYSYEDLTWRLRPALAVATGALAEYELVAGIVHYVLETDDTSNDCRQSAEGWWAVSPGPGLESALKIKWDMSYVGRIEMPGTVTRTETCPDLPPSTTTETAGTSAYFGSRNHRVLNMSSVQLSSSPGDNPVLTGSGEETTSDGSVVRWTWTLAGRR